MKLPVLAKLAEQAGVSADEVTSYTEVWIEITLGAGFNRLTSMSPPIRRCGLKFLRDEVNEAVSESPPIRRCGLKYFDLERVLLS